MEVATNPLRHRHGPVVLVGYILVTVTKAALHVTISNADTFK